MELWHSLGELLGILGVALAAGALFVRFRQCVTTGYILVYLFHHSLPVALDAGVALANIGEFAFVLAKLALSRGVLGEDGFRLLVTSAIIS